MIHFTDSHAHLSAPPLLEQIDSIIERARSAGVHTIVNICTGVDSLHKGLELSKRYPGLYNAAAVHPHDAQALHAEYFPLVEKHAQQKDLVAIGETGLDYHYQHSSRDVQKEVLRKHLKLALSCGLPVIIHCREAYADFFELLDAEYVVNGRHAPGVLHCFTGTMAEAQQVLERGWYLSLSGVVTFKKSEELRDVARIVPLDKLLIETDAPYLAPQSHRGKQNEPAYVVETAEVIAAVKQLSVAELAKATTQNAQNLFNFR